MFFHTNSWMIVSTRVDEFSGLKVNGPWVILAALPVLSACDIQLSGLILLNHRVQEEHNVSLEIKNWQQRSLEGCPHFSTDWPRAHHFYLDWLPLPWGGIGNPSHTRLSGTTGGLEWEFRTIIREPCARGNPSLPSALPLAEFLTCLQSISIYTRNSLNQPPLTVLVRPPDPFHPFHKTC